MAKHKKPDNLLVAVRNEGTFALPVHLLDDLRSLIRPTREGVAQAVNSTLMLL
jgi:hypothetical protein